MIARLRKWWGERHQRREEKRRLDAIVDLFLDAEKAANALDIMLTGNPWYGGVRVVSSPKPYIEVLIVDDFPGNLSAFVPPRFGYFNVLVRFGTLPKPS